MKNRTVAVVVPVLLIVGLMPGLATATQTEKNQAPSVGRSAQHDLSAPLRELAQNQRRTPGANRVVPNRTPLDLPGRHKPIYPPAQDPLRQTEPLQQAAALTPNPGMSFEGLSDDDNSATVGFRVVPPDTEGDVGLNHYVQWNNSIMAAWDKSTGNRVFGPIAGNAIWAGFGGPCEADNDGDPVVLFDPLANRWLVSQFSVSSGDGFECIAISTTSDPTGSYYRYAFNVSPGGFNDYPKLGVWPDGYYMTTNEFPSNSFDHAGFTAFERDQMLNGQPAQFVKFEVPAVGGEQFFAVQPSHLEGPAPAPGAPNVFVMAFDDETWGNGGTPDGYKVWEFSVDWVTPASSTLTALAQADTAEFDANMCNFSRGCIPQPKGKNRGEKLDSLSQFTMFRAQYRSFNDRDSIVVNHTVDVDGADTAGVRWAELRNTGGGWFVHQAGTYAPADGDNRWLGSIAMDGAGDIALAYNVSSTGTFPSVRYTTRTSTDALGTMPGGEVSLIEGTGAQQSSSNRWGDYSTISVDPVDDCTFWVTGEYYANNGSFDFKTRIGNFVVPECTGGGCTVTENPEVSCTDGLDNDCDGDIDAADSDCSGGSCFPVGDSCTVDADCCSNKCKGPRNGKTCK